ncbi:spore germination protein [Paenibacillus lycopersici]|uniref:Spore germination protein n=1 Tax=Paenibacillus lycopersici TaxID=2704462 RepID=A0A6C0G348_9BACL|nr:spore germination protein [Paenibacillus lycopersici]QHT61050.1 spore germination protein [Paenibacillus lycopersici]
MKETKPSEQFDIHSLDQLFSMIGKSSDFSRIQLETGHNGLTLSFYPSCRTAARFTIICSQASTVENLSINLHLMRRQSAIPQLVFEELTIGSLSKTTIAIAYIEGLTNPDIVQTMKDRLKGTVLDIVYDSSFPERVIGDDANTPFPLFLTTERIDRISYVITSGQIALFTSGSPYVLAGPPTCICSCTIITRRGKTLPCRA